MTRGILGCLTVAVIAACISGCGNRIESVISSTFDQVLPTNGQIFVEVRPPLDVEFERLDSGQVLAHEIIGSGTSKSDLVLMVDPGEVALGDEIDVKASCTPACPERSRATVRFENEDDTTPPVLSEGEVSVRAVGIRENPFDLFIARYDVSIRFGEVFDDSPTFVHFRSDEFEALRPTGGLAAFVEIDGGIERRLCFDANLVDIAGNETALAQNLCVELDPSTAAPWGELPGSEF